MPRSLRGVYPEVIEGLSMTTAKILSVLVFLFRSGFSLGLSVDQDHTYADQSEGKDQIGSDDLAQNKGPAQEHAKDRGEKGKGVQQTDGVSVDKLEPDEVAEEGNDDALVKQGKASKQRKVGEGGIFQHETHEEQ